MVLRGLLLIVPSFAIVGFAQNMPTLYLGLTLYALSTSVVVPCMTTLVSHYGNVSQKGKNLMKFLNFFSIFLNFYPRALAPSGSYYLILLLKIFCLQKHLSQFPHENVPKHKFTLEMVP